MLRIYSLDEGCAGGIVVVAESREAALAFFRNNAASRRYNPDLLSVEKIEEHEIFAGLTINFMGDQ